MNNTQAKQAKIQAGGPFYTSPNFIALLASALLAAFAGVTDTQIAAVAAFIPALFALWNNIKDGGTLPLRDWLGKANVRAWLASALILAIPKIPVELFDPIWQAIDAAAGKNWQAFGVALLSLFTIVYKIFKPALFGKADKN